MQNEIKRTNTINFSDRGIELIERIIKLNKEVSLLFSDTGDSLQIIIRTDTVESKYTFGEKDSLFTKQFNNINLGVEINFGAMFSVEERIISISNGITENGVDIIELVTPSNKTLLEVKADTPTYSSMIDIAPEAWEYMGRADLNSSGWNIYTRGTALTFMRGEEVEIYQSTSVKEKKIFGLFISKPDVEVMVKIQAILEML